MTHHLKQKKVLLIQTNYQSRINNFHLVVITLANSLILALLSKIIQGKNNMMKKKIYLLIMLKSITSNIDQLLQIKLSEEICVFFFIIKIYLKTRNVFYFIFFHISLLIWARYFWVKFHLQYSCGNVNKLDTSAP